MDGNPIFEVIKFDRFDILRDAVSMLSSAHTLTAIESAEVDSLSIYTPFIAGSKFKNHPLPKKKKPKPPTPKTRWVVNPDRKCTGRNIDEECLQNE
jgi:hypothetical protein